MLMIRKSDERGHAEHGWLDSYHTFSFADHHDPAHMGFRSLRVINDDIIAGGGGFGTHPHRDMEIITYVVRGALEHRDSMGNGSVIRAGGVQYMAAGTGVQHSESNPSPGEEVRLLQIWILPDRRGAKPSYAEKHFAGAETGKLHLVASKTGRDGSIAVNQDVDLWLVKFAGGEGVSHSIASGRAAWVQVVEGEVTLNGHLLAQGDGVQVDAEPRLELSAAGKAQVLLFDLG